MNFKILLEELLIEVDKKEVIVKKLGFTPEIADQLVSLCGGLSVWMGNKIINYQIQIINSWGEPKPMTKEEAINKITKHKGGLPQNWIQKITEIMDWVRVGLNGNLGEFKDLPFVELSKKSDEWHKSLTVENGTIDYVEKNEIIRDYRKNGFGFYWVNLNTNDSKEECDRMGHCGRTSGDNTLLSLRENIKINDKHTSNKSHLTAALGKEDGIIYQMKGGANSKPEERFHPYITDLILNDENIQGFGSEYKSENDFNLGDLPQNDIKKIYEQRPELFNTRKLKRILMDMGIIEKNTQQMIFDWKLDPSDIHYYVDGDWTISSGRRENTRNVGMFETLLSGDSYELFEPHGYDGDWEGAISYYLDKTNEKTLWELVNKSAKINDIDITGLDLEDSLKEVDNDEIINPIRWAVGDSETNSYHNYYYNTLKDALEEYGQVTQMNDDGVVIRVDLQKIINQFKINDDDLDNFFENCDDKPECVLTEIIGEYNDKPKFGIDDRWTPDIDKNDFNVMLRDRLSEITINESLIKKIVSENLKSLIELGTRPHADFRLNRMDKSYPLYLVTPFPRRKEEEIGTFKINRAIKKEIINKIEKINTFDFPKDTSFCVLLHKFNIDPIDCTFNNDEDEGYAIDMVNSGNSKLMFDADSDDPNGNWPLVDRFITIIRGNENHTRFFTNDTKFNAGKNVFNVDYVITDINQLEKLANKK